jgi:type 2 lantibiotic biosynthesis protein LanM
MGSGGSAVPPEFARALTLAERRPGEGILPGARRASERLASWAGQPPFGERAWWRARLAAAGLTEESLLALLAESGDQLAGRVPWPRWARWFTSVLLAPQAPAAGIAAGDDDDGAAFAPVAAPLLAAGRARLLGKLRRVAGARGSGCAFDPEVLTGQLFAQLPSAAHRLLLRTLVAELHKSRVAGQLPGADPAERFKSFVCGLSEDPSRRRALLTSYPVLARQLAVMVDGWVRAGEKLGRDLAADGDLLGEVFAGGSLGAVAEVVTGLGDRHRGGATVSRLRWTDGTELIYKPRPMRVDAHFQELLAWVNSKGVTARLRTVRCLDRGDHGWMEQVTAAACDDLAARRRFYRRHGALLALLYMLGGSDFHAENVIAAGEHPVLIDLETLIQPELPAPDDALSPADVQATEMARSSVTAAGLLPVRSWASRSGATVDVSGLGYRPGQRSPLAVAAVRDAGLDTMRIELQHVTMDPPAAQAAAIPAAGELLDHAPDILAGFTEVYRLCARHASELTAGPLAAFAGDEVRVVLRPTLWYTVLLSTSYHPRLLRDALDREQHFDALWRDVPALPYLAACTGYERADLWSNDVPVFSATASGTVLRASDGRGVRGVRLRPGMDRIADRLASLSEADLARQRWLITGALATTAIEELPPLPPRSPRRSRPVVPIPARPARPGGSAAGQPALLEAADKIGRELAGIGFIAQGSAQWLGVNSPRGTAWSLGPLRPDLFHGLTGIALFLGWLGQLTGDARHTSLARAALRTARCQLSQEPAAGSGSMPGGLPGGMAGAGGLCYALAELGKLWSDESLIDAAGQHARAAAREAPSDLLYDFVGGSAGSIAGLAALHALRPAADLEEGIRACADRLLATATRTPAGIGWLSSEVREFRAVRQPLAGFAHGGAGIILPLFHAARILADQRYRDAARQALRHEQALFDPRTRTWTAVTDPGGPTTYAGTPSWCYGGPGIGLSRLACLPDTGPDPVTAQEIDAALRSLSRPAASHCLCHGDLGNAELYLQAARTLRRPDLLQAAQQHGLQAITDSQATGWACGTPLNVQTPGLMFGLAGIGYGLLRIADPDHVPAVLTLSPGHLPGQQPPG